MKDIGTPGFYPFKGWVHHLAPVPLLYRKLEVDNIDDFNRELAAVAKRSFAQEILEVPDVRHLEDLGSVPSFPDTAWKEPQTAAVGAWHRVPTNSFLAIDDPTVHTLRDFIIESHKHAVEVVGDERYVGSKILENWIQFYSAGDYKVLHNHERYESPFLKNMWVGVYYVQDGDPDYDKKYSGIFSFSIRGCNYLVRPKPGLLLMFPSDILHEVHPFYGSSERIVVNFHVVNEDASA